MLATVSNPSLPLSTGISSTGSTISTPIRDIAKKAYELGLDGGGHTSLIGAEISRADAFEFYLARPIPQGLTRRFPSSDTPPLYGATLIPYAGGRRIPSGIPDAGEYRIELDRLR